MKGNCVAEKGPKEFCWKSKDSKWQRIATKELYGKSKIAHIIGFQRARRLKYIIRMPEKKRII